MPNNAHTIISYILKYTRYDLKRELLAWVKIAKFYLPVLIPAMIATVAAFIYIKPVPLNPTYLAIGQGSNLYEALSKSYTAFFDRNNLKLNVVTTSGLQSGLGQLQDEASNVNASFVTSGTATAKDYPNLVSLGSVDAAPLWLFYHGKTVNTDDPFEYFRDKKIAIGADGTVTQRLFTTLMELNNRGTGARTNFLHLPHTEAADRLRNGDIDAMFVVDGYHSPIIQSLLKDPNIQLMTFPLAEAYERKLPFLQKVTVPKASIDIDAVRPAKDVTLLATSVNLLVEKDLHPAMQWAFLMAAQDQNLKSERFFTATGPYPAYQDKSFPLSPVAARFYKNGTPALFEYIPLWLGALIDNLWIVILAAVLVVLPLIKKLSSLRIGASEKLLWKHFWELRYCEDLLHHAESPAQVSMVLVQLHDLAERVDHTWVGAPQIRHYYNLKRCIASCIKDAEGSLQQLSGTNTQ